MKYALVLAQGQELHAVAGDQVVGLAGGTFATPDLGYMEGPPLWGGPFVVQPIDGATLSEQIG
jgi:hypothetical protein